MSALSDITNLKNIIDTFQLEVGVETGTYRGTGTKHLSQFIDRIHTIEIMKECYDALPFHGSSNIFPYLGHSSDILPIILEKERQSRVLFWLDAHLPSIVHNVNQLTTEKEFPLESELQVIKNNKDTIHDVFLIDDLRLYEDGPFSDGNWKEANQFPNRPHGIDFIYKMFSETHTIEKHYISSGLVFIFPKSIPTK